MSQQKKKLVALTFKIHPDLLEEIDNFIDNIGYRSRGHVINRIVDDWLNRFHRKKGQKKK
jgi:metal-responsive CopG/Arc/MetJ family transcriptional regulator